MQRPSYKELFNKIREAKKAVAERRIIILNQYVIACDALELGYLIEEDLVNVLSDLLNEISPENYVGKRPPQKSYEQEGGRQKEIRRNHGDEENNMPQRPWGYEVEKG